MLNKRQFIEEEKDCASMLGLTLQEYRESLKNIKVSKSARKVKNRKYNSDILYKLGLTENDLKRRKVI